MHHTSHFASATPDRIAAIFPRGDQKISFGELEQAANRAAHAMQQIGLKPGDCIGISIVNRPEFLSVMLGAQRVGLHYVLLSTKLSIEDMAYIVEDSGARAVVISKGSFAAEEPGNLARMGVALLGIDLPAGAAADWSELVAAQPSSPPEQTSRGIEMLYSSGSTGRPKGIRDPLPGQPLDWDDPRNSRPAATMAIEPGSVFLQPCPLYHSAPHRFANIALHAGATLIVPDRFDAGQALAAIEAYRCTHSLWVPTMFHRMLQLPTEVRNAADLSSHKCAIHGAAPCPVHVKHKMIEWWGPILEEYYSGSEGIGSTAISSAEWLAHPGSVGKPNDTVVHILGPDGEELAAGETGDIFFETAKPFQYWGKADADAKNPDPRGWNSLGDVGYIDADGYLYLTDRRHFMIISGGVNIYPQEIEFAFLEHPAVRDVAVIGVPNDEFGQEVRAVVQLNQPDDADAEMEDILRRFIRKRLGPVKTPKSIVFVEDFPRHATGKLYKQELIARYG